METSDKLIPILKTLGFKEISKESLRIVNYKEVIEYWDGKTWRDFALK